MRVEAALLDPTHATATGKSRFFDIGWYLTMFRPRLPRIPHLPRVFLIVLSALAGFANCKQLDQEILISRAQIQATVEKRFPYDKNLIVARLVLDNPKVYFTDHKVGMRMHFSGNMAQREVGGTVDFNGELIYRPDEGAFYLKNLAIAEVTVGENTTVDKAVVRSAVAKIANNYLDRFPVYQLKSDNFKHSLAKLVLKKVHVRNQALVVTMGL